MNVVQPIRDLNKIKQVKTILKRKSSRNYFLFVFGINTGLRISDILPLRVVDIKGKESITFIEEKNEKRISFCINPKLRKEIKNYVKGMKLEDYLFPSRNNNKSKPISRVMAYNILNNAAREVGLEQIGTHTFRKTFGYHFYKKYQDVALLQRIFKHYTQSETLRYIGIEQDVQDKAMENFSL